MAAPVPMLVQSHYSLREGTLPVSELVSRAVAAGAPGLVLADHNAMWGLPELAAGAAPHGIAAVPACALTVIGALGERDELVLAAAGPEGYRSLCRAVTAAHLGGPAGAHGLPAEALPEFATGLVALAGARSEPGRLLRTGRAAAARDAAARLAAAFPGAAFAIPGSGLGGTGVPQWDPAGFLAAYRPAFPAPRPRFPRFPAPDGLDPGAYLGQLARTGLDALGLAGRPGYAGRLAHEVDVIVRLGLAGYFLIIWDLVRHARAAGVPVGPGRGSAVGSLAAYALGITGVDPIPHGLYFERFLNPERADLPDIDLDVCSRGRSRLLAYLHRRWGAGAVAQCGLIAALGARGAVREAGRQLALDPALVDRVARLFPHSRAPGGIDAALRELPEFRRLDPEQEPVRSLLQAARTLEGRPWNVSVHAAGVVIGPGPLADLVPLMRAGGGEVITQYQAEALEAMGLIKIDLLGLRNLTVIADVQASLPGLDVAAQPPGDPAVYRMLAAGEGIGVFQLDSPGMRRLLRQLRPERFDDLVAVLALYRPGPFQAGSVHQFIRRRWGKEAITHPHPAVAAALADTYGVLVYQEQVMAIARDVAGFSPGQADDLRRALGRGPRQAAAWRDRFLAGARRRGLPEAAAATVWTYLADHAGYSFNKAHTTAYGLVAYWTAYLKCHYPARYFAALLAIESGYYGPGVYTQEAARRGVRLEPPDVNRSGLTYQPEGEAAIRMGLLQVRGVGPAAAQALLAEREAHGPFAAAADLAERLGRRGVPHGAVAALVAAGAVSAGDGARPAGTRQMTLADLAPSAAETAPAAPAALPGMFPAALTDCLRRRGARPAAHIAALPADSIVVAGGLVAGSRRRRTERGMGLTLLLQDGTGLVEVLVPPEVYQRDLEQIDPRGIVVRGRTLGGGEARLVAERIRACGAP